MLGSASKSYYDRSDFLFVVLLSVQQESSSRLGE